MKLQEIYDQMVYGEASNIFIGKRSRDDVEFVREDLPKVLAMVRSGLTDIHTRMLMKVRTITLPITGTDYVLAPEDDDLLEIHKIEGMYLGEVFEIPFDGDDPAGIRRMDFNTLSVPTDPELAPWLRETTELKVSYHANHPEIRAARANSAPGSTYIDLPRTHLNALIWFMASRMHNPVGMKQEFHAGNNYAMKYEAEIQRLQQLGHDIERVGSHSHFNRSGMP